MPLKTDYKNFIPSTTTKIHDIKQASDETVLYEDVILEDVTIYSQEGDAFGSADINATNAQVNANTDAIALKAPLSNPEFTDIPKAPTAPTGTDTTQIASTEFVQQELDVHKAESANKHITESGNNENGYYLKFDDGTMVCYKTSLTTLTTAGGTTPLFKSPPEAWTYPASFINIPTVTVSPVRSAGSVWVGNAAGIYTAYANGFFLYGETNASAGTLSFMAIGRWK